MALGLGYGLPFSVKRPVQSFAEDVALSVNNALADAAQREEAGNCLAARAIDIMQTVQTQPSLLIVPQLYKAGVLYDQLPTTRTNFLPNNSMAGATGSVLPTTWASGSIPAGFTFSVGASGQATANDGTVVNYVDVSVSGTATASGTFNLFFSAATGAVTATTGQTFTLSAYATCISGDITTPAMVLQVQEVSGSTFQAGTSTNIALASGAVLQRLSAVRTFNQSGVTASRGRIGHPIVSGTTYSYTIRIASPQLERLGVPTPMIATSTGAVTRLNESTNVVGLPPDFTVSRNTTATRVNSSGLIESVASGVPRIDWLGQSCPALLVEASGQNLALQSENFTTTWSSLNGTASTGTTAAFTAPDGTTNANLFTESTDVLASNHQLSQSIGTAVVSGTSYTLSCFFKATAANRSARLSLLSTLFSGSPQAFFDVTSGVVGTTTDCTARIENYGNGWYRCSITAICDVSGTASVFIGPASGNTRDYIGNGSASLYLWGAQLETGSIATTYIPTTTGSGSRAADGISASGSLVSGLIGQTEGTIYAEVDIRNLTDGRILTLFNSATRYIVLSKAINRLAGFVIDTSSSPITLVSLQTASGSLTAGTYKLALAYASGDFAFYVNGTQVATSATGGVIGGYTSLRLGNFDTSLFFNDRIRAAALYTTRLSNDQLAELTRL